MVDLDKLYNDEAYTLKVLIELVIKYISSDSEKVEHIQTLSRLPGCIPGRAVGVIFRGKSISEGDQKIIQEIINIYG